MPSSPAPDTNRVFRTKESVRQALIALLEDHDVNRIKAADVYNRARVSKATFYRYYRDVFDLLVECFALYLDVQPEVGASIEAGSFARSTRELILLGTRRIQRYPRLYLACVQCTYAPFLQDFSARSTHLSERSVRRLVEDRGLTAQTCAIDVDRLAQLSTWPPTWPTRPWRPSPASRTSTTACTGRRWSA